ncbi:DUF4143 domain-containing protein [Planctomycetota bacterium]
MGHPGNREHARRKNDGNQHAYQHSPHGFFLLPGRIHFCPLRRAATPERYQEPLWPTPRRSGWLLRNGQIACEAHDRRCHRGMLIETWVLQNILGIVASHGMRVYFWSVQGRHEVDFVIEAAGKVVAVEVKAASRWDKKDLSGLRAFLAATPHCEAAVLAYNGETVARLDDRLLAIPLSLLLA